MPSDTFKSRLKALVPAPIAVNWRERLRACVGALVGLLITAALSHLFPAYPVELPWIIAPMGASAVLLFAVPASPLAQPWPVLVGNVLAAVIGVSCAKLLGHGAVAAAVTAALTIAAMYVGRCIHPPAGAIALTAVLGGPAIHAEGYRFVLEPVALNSLLLVLTAIVYHRVTRHRYPHVVPSAPRESKDSVIPGFTSRDLDLALQSYNELLDVDRDDLEMILRQAQANAYRRRFGEVTCADVMTSNVVTVVFGDLLEDAWALMQKHRVKALPVVDRTRRIVGIITLADFLKHSGVEKHRRLGQRVSAFVKRVETDFANKPDAVGQIMTRRVQVVSVHKPIAELVPMFAQSGHHHIPVIDNDNRLVGMITQTDLIQALYSQNQREAVA